MGGYEYHKPQTIQEAISLMDKFNDEAVYISGGTDVMVLLRQKKLKTRNLVSLRNINTLSYLDTEGGLKVGSGTTHSEIAKNEQVKRFYTALNDATTQVGSRQIRNVATVGGNICNAAPSADTACPLLVLDAKVVVEGKKGERQIDVDDFFLGPNKVALEKGEVVKGFHMPYFGENTGSAYIKHTRRQAMELPILGIAVRVTINIGGSELGCKDAFCTIDSISNILKRLEDEELVCDDVRIAMGVVAPRPMRAKKAESALKGKVISEKLFEEIGEIAMAESQPRDSIRGEAWYRREMVKVLTKRAILYSIDRVIRPDEAIHLERLRG
jgi:carbon-monoxide dehydrogenase medium subunit